MRVLWVSHASQRGGAELVLEEGVRSLREAGVETVVVLPEDGPLKSMLEESGVKTVHCYLPWWAGGAAVKSYISEVRGFISSVRGMMRVIRQESPDVVLTNTLTIPAPAMAARVLRVPHVWMIQEFLDSDHGLRFHFGRKASLWYVDKLSRKAAVASDAVRRAFEDSLGEGKIEKVTYAVDFPRPTSVVERPLSGAFRLVLVGAKYPGKGQETAVRAVSVLKERGKSATLELVGQSRDGYDVVLEGLCRELGVEDRVFHIGATDDPYRYSGTADAVLVCSSREAFGRVTVEGMKLGRPVVAASSGAGSELIEDGVTGLLFETLDHEHLADRIQMLMDDPALAGELGRNAKEWSDENFTSEKYGNALRRLCEMARISSV